METLITRETISQQIICGDNEGYNDSVDNSKEETKFKKKHEPI